jgi:hypothetical protein
MVTPPMIRRNRGFKQSDRGGLGAGRRFEYSI